MDRREWTEQDERIVWRRYVGEKYALDDPEILPAHLRDATRDHWRNPAAPRRKGKHASDDQEGSRVVMRVDVGTVVKVAAVVALVVVGVRVVRSLMP